MIKTDIQGGTLADSNRLISIPHVKAEYTHTKRCQDITYKYMIVSRQLRRIAMTILISTRHADNLQEISDELEAIVDRYTLANVLDGLALVCSSKADHIRENWQDSPLADKWDKAVGHILSAKLHADNLQEISDELEVIVDRYTLGNVLDGLALVCSSKADHIRENWQDNLLADKWDNAVGHILKAKLYADSKDL